MLQDDTIIIKSILAGHINEYAVLVDRHKDMAFTVAYRLLNNREDAEEVIQDAFVKAFRHLSDFRQESKFTTWLFRIVYNTAMSKCRLKKPVLQTLDEVPSLRENPDVTGIENDDLAEKGMILEKAMEKLTEEERALITLYYIQESSVEEIHSITGMSKSNVKIRLFRARRKLKEFAFSMIERIYI